MENEPTNEAARPEAPRPMTLDEWRAVSYERHREVMRRLNQACFGTWIAAFGALGLMAYWWGLIPLRFAFLGDNPLGL